MGNKRPHTRRCRSAHEEPNNGVSLPRPTLFRHCATQLLSPQQRLQSHQRAHIRYRCHQQGIETSPQSEVGVWHRHKYSRQQSLCYLLQREYDVGIPQQHRLPTLYFQAIRYIGYRPQQHNGCTRCCYPTLHHGAGIVWTKRIYQRQSDVKARHRIYLCHTPHTVVAHPTYDKRSVVQNHLPQFAGRCLPSFSGYRQQTNTVCWLIPRQRAFGSALRSDFR